LKELLSETASLRGTKATYDPIAAGAGHKIVTRELQCRNEQVFPPGETPRKKVESLLRPAQPKKG